MSLQPGVLLGTGQAQLCSTSLGGRAGTEAWPVAPTRVVGVHPPGGGSAKGVSWWHLGGSQQWLGLSPCCSASLWAAGLFKGLCMAHGPDSGCCRRCPVRCLEGSTHPSVLPGERHPREDRGTWGSQSCRFRGAGAAGLGKEVLAKGTNSAHGTFISSRPGPSKATRRVCQSSVCVTVCAGDCPSCDGISPPRHRSSLAGLLPLQEPAGCGLSAGTRR